MDSQRPFPLCPQNATPLAVSSAPSRICLTQFRVLGFTVNKKAIHITVALEVVYPICFEVYEQMRTLDGCLHFRSTT